MSSNGRGEHPFELNALRAAPPSTLTWRLVRRVRHQAPTPSRKACPRGALASGELREERNKGDSPASPAEAVRAVNKNATKNLTAIRAVQKSRHRNDNLKVLQSDTAKRHEARLLWRERSDSDSQRRREQLQRAVPKARRRRSASSAARLHRTLAARSRLRWGWVGARCRALSRCGVF